MVFRKNLFLGSVAGSLNPFAEEASFFSDEIPDYITFSRASVATDLINGELVDFASGEPRISTYNGFLLEPAATNHIRNGESGGATLGVIGSGGAMPTNHTVTLPSGVDAEIVEFGTVSGFNYYDITISGSGTGNVIIRPESLSQITAASGNRWIASAWVGLIDGDLTNVTSVGIRVNECASGSELTGTTKTFTPTIDPNRQFVQRLFNNGGTTHAGMEIIIPVTGAVDFTLRLSSFQLESGASGFFTSYIRTTSASATRASDFAYIAVGDINFSQSEGTIIVAGQTKNYFSGSGWKNIVTVQGNDQSQHRIALFHDQSQGTFRVMTVQNYSTVSVDSVFFPCNTDDVEFIAGMAWAVDNFYANVNNTATVSDTSLPSIPPSTRIYIAGTNTQSYNYYITGFKYANTRLSNSLIQNEVTP